MILIVNVGEGHLTDNICYKSTNIHVINQQSLMFFPHNISYRDPAQRTCIPVGEYLMDEDNESNTSLHLAVSKRRTEV